MRYFTSVLILLLLAGCADIDSGPMAGDSRTCEGLAAARAQDAADNGVGSDLQKKIYDTVLKQCSDSPSQVTVVNRSGG